MPLDQVNGPIISIWMIQNVQSGVWDFNGALLCPRILAIWQSKQLLTQLAITVFMRGYTKRLQIKSCVALTPGCERKENGKG